jgi:hypothetical protein
MTGNKEQYDKIFFKFLLLTVYFVFFTVQLLLRYTSPQSQQSLETDNCCKTLKSKSGIPKNIVSRDDPKKNKSLTYLNKRYHPKDGVIIPSMDFQVHYFYAVELSSFYSSCENIPGTRIKTASLRGPPAIS